MIIYHVQNKINKRYYIGVTKQTFAKRISQHEQSSKNPKSPFHRALFKYGLDNFHWSILDNTAKNLEELKQLEITYIKMFKAKFPGCYNMTDGGDGQLNPTDELRKKLSDSHKGLPCPESTKIKLRARYKGIKRSPETIAKMKLPRKNRIKNVHINI